MEKQTLAIKELFSFLLFRATPISASLKLLNALLCGAATESGVCFLKSDQPKQ